MRPTTARDSPWATPLGATGALLLGTALDELERRDAHMALITMCIAGGQGIATILERLT